MSSTLLSASLLTIEMKPKKWLVLQTVASSSKIMIRSTAPRINAGLALEAFRRTDEIVQKLAKYLPDADVRYTRQ